MIRVYWRVAAETVVNTTEAAEAISEVETLFEEKLWGDTGRCQITIEHMVIDRTEAVGDG